MFAVQQNQLIVDQLWLKKAFILSARYHLQGKKCQLHQGILGINTKASLKVFTTLFLMFCNIFEVWISYIRFCNFFCIFGGQTDRRRTDKPTNRKTDRQADQQTERLTESQADIDMIEFKSSNHQLTSTVKILPLGVGSQGQYFDSGSRLPGSRF